jgi:hypothetical protein
MLAVQVLNLVAVLKPLVAVVAQVLLGLGADAHQGWVWVVLVVLV